MVESYRRRVRKDRETGLAALTLAAGGICMVAMVAAMPAARAPGASSTTPAQRMALVGVVDVVDGVVRIPVR